MNENNHHQPTLVQMWERLSFTAAPLLLPLARWWIPAASPGRPQTAAGIQAQSEPCKPGRAHETSPTTICFLRMSAGVSVPFLHQCVTGLKKKKKKEKGKMETTCKWAMKVLMDISQQPKLFINLHFHPATTNWLSWGGMSCNNIIDNNNNNHIKGVISSPPTCWTVALGDSRTDGGWMRHTSSRVCTTHVRHNVWHI